MNEIKPESENEPDSGRPSTVIQLEGCTVQPVPGYVEIEKAQGKNNITA